MDTQTLEWIRLAGTPGVGWRSLLRANAEWDDGQGGLLEWWRRAGSEVARGHVRGRIPGIERARRLLQSLREDGIGLARCGGANCPGILNEVPPEVRFPLYYYRGALGLLETPTVAIVGSRRSPARAQQVAFRAAQRYVEREWTVLAGGTTPVEKAAHEGALKASGKTILLLGAGLKAQSIPLALRERISERTALVLSPFPVEQRQGRRAAVIRNQLLDFLARELVAVWADPGGAIDCMAMGRLRRGASMKVVDPEELGEASPANRRLGELGAEVYRCGARYSSRVRTMAPVAPRGS